MQHIRLMAVLAWAWMGMAVGSAALHAETWVTGTAGKSPTKTVVDSAKVDLTEFLARKSALKEDDVEGRLNLAKWCRDKEMWAQMGDMAKEVLERDPENRVAYVYLKLLDEKVAIERDEKEEERISEELKERFEHDFTVHSTRHFVLFYDTTKEFAVSRGVSLEKAFDSFMYYFNMRKLRPKLLEKRLVVILLKDRNDYLKYAKEVDGADLAWSAGYYSQRTNRATFYDDTTGPAAEKAEQDVVKWRERVKELNTQISAANAKGQRGLVNQLTVERNRISNGIAQWSLRVDNAVGLINNVKTVHEAAHQLAFNTGVQKRQVDYPLWFSEGLACSFEVEDRNNNRGPAVLNWGRIAVVKTALKGDKMVPLEKFITQSSPEELDTPTLSVWYAQGWAMFHYMYKFHRPELEKYLLGFQAAPVGVELSAEKRRRLFTDAFGEDVTLFEKKWLEYLKGLPNPPK